MGQASMGVKKDPILITGAARSGTSMVAGIIHKSGAWGGKMSGPTRYNRKGMFELSDIRQKIVKPFLARHNWDPLGQNPLPGIKEMHRIANSVEANHLRYDVHRIIKRQGYQGGPWMYKGAKMCLMWPLWHAAFPNATWIVVRRNRLDIIASCIRTGFMRAFKTYEGWSWWAGEHEDRFLEMDKAGLDGWEIWPQSIINGDFEIIQAVVSDLGLRWQEDEVRAFVDSKLWHKAV